MTARGKGLGFAGEEIAEDHLRQLGYRIVARDVATRLGQLDLIARDGASLVLVEVKTRAGTQFGLPQEAVGPQKVRKLRQLAAAYLIRHPHPGPVRFDVIGLTIEHGRLTRLDHVKNAI